MKARVFVSRDAAERFREATELVASLNKRGLKAELVDKLSAKRDDLLAVAEYGVVEACVVVLIDESGVRARLTHLPAADELEATMRRLAA